VSRNSGALQPVGVNLSDIQVLDPALGSVIERLRARHRLRPGEIAIELDSQILLHEPDRLFPRLLQLPALMVDPREDEGNGGG